MENKIFERLLEEIKVCDINKVNEIVKTFNEQWNKNCIENEFYSLYTRKKFYDALCDRIVENGNYPLELHKILVDNLSADNVVKLSSSVVVEPELIRDYENIFIQDDDYTSCAKLVKVKGAGSKRLASVVVKSNNVEDFMDFVKNCPDCNIKLFKEKILVLLRTAKNDKLYSRRQNAFQKLSQIEKERNKEVDCQK